MQDVIALPAPGDEIFAIGNECPHQAGSLCDGWVEGEIVTLPAARLGVRPALGRLHDGARRARAPLHGHVEDGAVYLEPVE